MCVHFLKISSKEWNYRVKGPEIVTKTKILPVAPLYLIFTQDFFLVCPQYYNKMEHRKK